MKKTLFIFTCIALLVFFSCSEKAPSVQIEEGDTATDVADVPVVNEPVAPPTPDVTEPDPKPDIDETLTERSALTGLPISVEESRIRPTAVVFNNHNKALPQVGIKDADVVWEFNVEGGITRLLAIYSDISKVETIGAVRSGRDYFLDVAEMYGALLVHAGGSDSFYAEDKARGYDNIDEVNMHTIPSDTFWRNSEKRYSRGYEHSLETSGKKLIKAFESQRYKLECDSNKPLFEFSEERFAPSGDTAEIISAKHSAYITPRFIYNSEDGKYYKESYNAPHVDEATGEPLSFDNLLIVFASQRVVDEYLRLEIDLSGTGDAILVTAGHCVDIKWKISDGRLAIEYPDGTDVPLNVGKTHITVFNALHKDGIIIE